MKWMFAGCLLLALIALGACASPPTTGGGGGGGAPSVPTTGGSGGGGAGDMPSVPTTGSPAPSTGNGDMGNDDEAGGSDVDDAATTAGAVGSTDTAEASADASAEGGISEEPAMTADERKRALARKLDQSLNDFDSTLEDEQRRTAVERDARTASAPVLAAMRSEMRAVAVAAGLAIFAQSEIAVSLRLPEARAARGVLRAALETAAP
jgi:hypothetical protein